MNLKDFYYQKRVAYREFEMDYEWYLIHKASKSGVHFHGHKYHDPAPHRSLLGCNRYNFSTFGIERHAPSGEGKPSHEQCWVTAGPCWHDGTSLGASERLGHINPDRDDDEVWAVLEDYHQSWFGRHFNNGNTEVQS